MMNSKAPWHEVMRSVENAIDLCADEIAEVESRLYFIAPDSKACAMLRKIWERLVEQNRVIYHVINEKVAEDAAAAQQASENMLNAAVIGMKLAGIPTPNPQEKEQ